MNEVIRLPGRRVCECGRELTGQQKFYCSRAHAQKYRRARGKIDPARPGQRQIPVAALAAAAEPLALTAGLRIFGEHWLELKQAEGRLAGEIDQLREQGCTFLDLAEAAGLRSGESISSWRKRRQASPQPEVVAR